MCGIAEAQNMRILVRWPDKICVDECVDEIERLSERHVKRSDSDDAGWGFVLSDANKPIFQGAGCRGRPAPGGEATPPGGMNRPPNDSVTSETVHQFNYRAQKRNRAGIPRRPVGTPRHRSTLSPAMSSPKARVRSDAFRRLTRAPPRRISPSGAECWRRLHFPRKPCRRHRS